MKKWLKILLIAIAVLIVIAGGAILYINKSLSINKEPATLYIDSGNVNVIRDGQALTGTNEMKLEQSDTIETLDNAKAKVMLYNSIFVMLDANTKITLTSLLEKNIKISQESGTTWNKVSKLFGITNYEVETPTSVATVRGTEFEINASATEAQIILVDGKVTVKNDQGNEILLDNIGKVKVTSDSITEVELTDADVERLIAKVKETRENMKNERFHVSKKTVEQSDLIKSQLETLAGEEVNDNTITEFYNDIDDKRTDINEVERTAYEKLPVLNKEIVTYAKDISNKIDEQDAIIAKIMAKKPVNVITNMPAVNQSDSGNQTESNAG